MFYKFEDIKNSIKNSLFYNFPDDWISEGIVMNFGDPVNNNIVIAKEADANSGFTLDEIKKYSDKISAILTSASITNYRSCRKPIIKVDKTDNAIVSLGKYARAQHTGKVIAVTGSCGKSTCCSILNNIFSDSSCVNKGNTYLRIAQNLTTFPKKDYWIVEVSVCPRMDWCSELILPDYAIITNIAPVHLSEMTDVSYIAKKKMLIFNSMKEGSYAILYKDMENFDLIKKNALAHKLNIITFGEKDADVVINCEENNNYIEIFEKKLCLSQEAIPKHIMLSMAAAATVAYLENKDPDNICQKLSEFQYIEGRGQAISGNISKNIKVTIIDDAYNANPISMESAIEGFKVRFKNTESNVLVLGDMAEGGINTIKNHIKLEKIIRETKPSRVLLCGENMKVLWDTIKFDFKGAHYADSEALNKDILNWVKNGDNILIKASHSTNLYKTVDMFKQIINSYTKKDAVLKEIPTEGELVDIKEQIMELFSNYQEYVPSIHVWDYKSKKGININSDTICPAASIIKIPILIEFVKQIYEKKTMNFTDTMIYSDEYYTEGSGYLRTTPFGNEYTLDYLANIMISDSDNVAANMILDKIGGVDVLSSVLKDLHYKNIKISDKLPDIKAKNKISTYEVSKMLFNLDSENFIKKEYATIIKNYLLYTKNNTYLKGQLPKSALFYHKTGTLLGIALNDCGIVVDRSKDLKYIISVSIKMPYIKGNREKNLQIFNTTKDLMQKTSLLVYNGILNNG